VHLTLEQYEKFLAALSLQAKTAFAFGRFPRPIPTDLPVDLLRPYAEEDMESWRVSDKVGNTKNNWTELIEPIPEDTRDPRKSQSPKRNCRPNFLIDFSAEGDPLVPSDMLRLHQL
jgi:hypothetical protein